ncbi:MAG: type II secretion system protein [Candidatus Paceibacterota bacterium]
MIKKNGFALVELVIVAGLIAALSVALILNFRTAATNKTARGQVASVVVSDIRRAQSMALSGSRFQGNIVCGFGIHYINSTSYLIYAGSTEGLPDCTSTNHNYQAGVDSIFQTITINNPSMEMRSSFLDIFFEPPDPKTYINNNSSLGVAPATVTVQLVGQQNCGGQSCTNVQVYTSGQLDIENF